ncbi:MAG: hypothetical protein M4579_004835 [Chaenotheca gracillima]|nr:MAG: hypothetical protein M4579_004835 [Chaenotheca gracillima]
MADFDIVSTYRNLLSSDPELTMPVAAIESLVELLAHSRASTVSETLDLLNTSILHLKRSIPNSLSLSAGTDLFQRYLTTTLNPRPTSSGAAVGDFHTIRQHLISNGRLFVTRAKAGREKIAAFGKHFVRDGTTVLTSGGSRVVGALLRRAAEDSKGSVRFRVIYVLPDPSSTQSASSGSAPEGHHIIDSLRELGVPVATIPQGAVGYALGKVDLVIVGAEGVVENGGIISRLGTYQLGLLARAAVKPFYVVAESHKFVRLYPLGQYDLGIEQRIIEFRTSTSGTTEEDGMKTPMALEEKETQGGYFDDKAMQTKSFAGEVKDAVDFTPPDLISALITESGVLTPSAVSEELIKIWF